MRLVCDPASCATETHDHTTPVDVEGNDVDPAVPMICGDCLRPAYYDYADDQYHHNQEPERGCFLIPSE